MPAAGHPDLCCAAAAAVVRAAIATRSSGYSRDDHTSVSSFVSPPLPLLSARRSRAVASFQTEAEHNESSSRIPTIAGSDHATTRIHELGILGSCSSRLAYSIQQTPLYNCTSCCILGNVLLAVFLCWPRKSRTLEVETHRDGAEAYALSTILKSSCEAMQQLSALRSRAVNTLLLLLVPVVLLVSKTCTADGVDDILSYKLQQSLGHRLVVVVPTYSRRIDMVVEVRSALVCYPFIRANTQDERWTTSKIAIDIVLSAPWPLRIPADWKAVAEWNSLDDRDERFPRRRVEADQEPHRR